MDESKFGELVKASQIKNGDIVIAVLDRGWVMIGRYWGSPQEEGLIQSSCVRSWGTNRGLGQLAHEGVTSSTILDPEGACQWPVVCRVKLIKCDQKVWEGKLPTV